MAQVADREAHLEHDLLATYDAYELDFTALPKPEDGPTHRTPPPHRSPASRRRNRGR
ncbi:hypothetical protein ABZV52_17015 [Streptomyces sp. NPDC004735]|uniref:hypothetical protein n=1 Tax=Streptomyces sp. NPDC004735 TaxID=3156654 RepID=UPI0033BBB747